MAVISYINWAFNYKYLKDFCKNSKQFILQVKVLYQSKYINNYKLKKNFFWTQIFFIFNELDAKILKGILTAVKIPILINKLKKIELFLQNVYTWIPKIFGFKFEKYPKNQFKDNQKYNW